MRRVHPPRAGQRLCGIAIVVALMCSVGGAGSAVAADRAPAALQQRPVPANADAAVGAPPAERGQRVESLLDEVARLRADALEQRQAIEELRLRAAAAESGERLLRALALLLGVVSALAVWLALRLRRAVKAVAPASRERLRHDAAHAESPSALASTTTHAAAAPHVEARATTTQSPAEAPSGFITSSGGDELAAIAPPPRPAAPVDNGRGGHDPYTTAAMPRPMSASMFDLSGAGPLDALSVDEQLDLEQQAEFFIAIGQEEAAIELLQGSVRAGRGADPLPYLKLLALHARRDDREAYERTALRFARRYNARVPACGDALDGGRVLEQYPQVLAELATAWREPAAALALLQALLLRARENGAALAPPFDLPAFEELVLLHQVARALDADAAPQQRPAASGRADEGEQDGIDGSGSNRDGILAGLDAAARAADVDVLLPLGEEERVLRGGESLGERTQVLPRWRP